MDATVITEPRITARTDLQSLSSEVGRWAFEACGGEPQNGFRNEADGRKYFAFFATNFLKAWENTRTEGASFPANIRYILERVNEHSLTSRDSGFEKALPEIRDYALTRHYGRGFMKRCTDPQSAALQLRNSGLWNAGDPADIFAAVTAAEILAARAASGDSATEPGDLRGAAISRP